MPEYIVRFVQLHESFRRAELQALADLVEVPIEFVHYSDEVSDMLEQHIHTVSVRTAKHEPPTPCTTI